jgi:hypothetical protein
VRAGRTVTDSYDFRQARAQLQQQSIESKEHRHDNAEIFEASAVPGTLESRSSTRPNSTSHRPA